MISTKTSLECNGIVVSVKYVNLQVNAACAGGLVQVGNGTTGMKMMVLLTHHLTHLLRLTSGMIPLQTMTGLTKVIGLMIIIAKNVNLQELCNDQKLKL